MPIHCGKKALFNEARTREQGLLLTFNHHLLASCLGKQLFKGAGAPGSTLSGCRWVPNSFEIKPAHHVPSGNRETEPDFLKALP